MPSPAPGSNPTPVKHPLYVADKTPANGAKRDQAVPGDASDKQPDGPRGGGSDPLSEMSARNVEEAIAQAEGLAADAAEQVGAGEGEPETDQPPAQGESETDRQHAGSASEPPSDPSVEGQTEADPVDKKLAQLEALLSGVREDGQKPEQKPPAQPPKQPEPPATDRREGTSTEGVNEPSEQEANELDELIAGAVDAEAVEGAESGPSSQPQDAQQRAAQDGEANGPDTAVDADQRELDDQASNTEPNGVDAALEMLARAVCVTLEVIDRPFQRLGQQAKNIIGWVGLGTLAVAAVVLFLTFLIY